jgi:hypothetical protein
VEWSVQPVFHTIISISHGTIQDCHASNLSHCNFYHENGLISVKHSQYIYISYSEYIFTLRFFTIFTEEEEEEVEAEVPVEDMPPRVEVYRHDGGKSK